MLMQHSNPEFFSGVVENRMDPNMAGRVQVRVMGVHPFSRIQGDIEGIPVEDLPWMSICMPATSASKNGVGSSNTGLLEGSHVFGLWLDKYKTNGIVLGSISGKMLVSPNPNEGFSDPTGQYSEGNDTNPLGIGTESGQGADANAIQDANLGTGLAPDGKPWDQQTPDNNPSMTMDTMLRRDEGVKNQLYWDKLGFPTIGIGHLILATKTRDSGQINAALSRQLGRSVSGSRPTISHDEIIRLFEDDLARIQKSMRKNKKIAAALASCNKSRQMALENMAFQLGVGGLANFSNSLALIAAQNWKAARASLMNSLWARQTPGRAQRVSLIILSGNLSSYGVKASAKTARGTLVAPVNNAESFLNNIPDNWDDIDWSAEIPDDDSLVMFTEPASSYKGEYPYVHVYQSESGHVQEFDDTPGNERYRIMHPTGTYTETAADGRKTDKVVGDQYNIVDGTRYESASNLKRSIAGDDTLYTVGNSKRTIGADSTLTIHGSRTEVIQGDWSINVQGSAKINVQGTADIGVQGNATTDVNGDYSLKVGGSLNWEVGGGVNWEVGGSVNQKMSALTQEMGGAYSVTASRVDIQ